MPSSADAEDLADRLDRIQKLTDELAKCQRDAENQRALADRIHHEIALARKSLKPAR